ncbi:transcriptional regulator, TetR family [Deinococcus reticulitermitis]|uniref:Transcriptional regulator, TetR family n=1 Tax=Deinococcus reticulitermitis TaxID=856736 RepID=A0A1H6XA63_9DEIO|nr:TetR/AcrR family transcriptional regulator [Deinococcus reticulitermitis]SEJ25046.1 transcriptional regulator, TetR family [Deinococcus reticulitermitis]
MPYPAKLTTDQILDAAQTLLETQGAEALTMRSLAQVLGVQASSLYRHHASRDVLLLALSDRAALELLDTLLDVSRGLSPRAALEGAAQAYLDYARSHPNLYALLLLKRGPLSSDQLARSAGKQLWNGFLRLVGALSGDPDDTDHAVAYWTLLHGFAELERSGAFGASGPRGGLDVGLTAILDHMEAAAG